MKTTARVVVIGGGVVGVSTLYHLAKLGWSDVALIERKELTSGSTWHAAGLLPLFNLSYSVGKLHQYSVALYPSLEAETGLNVGFSNVSNIRIATSQDRLDEYRYYAGVAKTIGVAVNWLTPEQLKEVWPLADVTGVLGAIQHPADGYIQPADLTQALAKGARQLGATIYRNTTVTAITQLPSGEWLVSTDQGDITCEHVVSATGNFARQTGEMVGLDVPVIPVEHQYIVTEQVPAIMERRKQGLPEMGVLRESDDSWYMREEAGGLLLGPYELGAPACYVKGPAANSEYELFPDALERLEPYIMSAMARVPAFGEVGVKKVYNGAIAYTPDGSPIVGPAWDKKNFWLNEGHSFGITAAGGAGWQLAHWIVNGEPTIDMTGVDPRRFGEYAGEGYLIEKNEEAYAKVFAIHYPDEEREAGRALRRTPCYDRMKDLGAVFGSVFGWERPNWFAPKGYELTDADLDRADTLLNHNHPVVDGEAIREKWSFRRSNYFNFVADECRHVTKHVGLQDMSAFAKCQITGPGAEDWLNGLLSNTVPKKVGKVTLSYLLTDTGGVRAEFTVYKKAPQTYYLVSAGAMERHDQDYLLKALPTDGTVRFERLTTAMGVLVLAGPRARDVLSKVTQTDLSSAAFPWLTGKTISIGAARVEALRVNFVGELGWEFHHPIEMQNYIFDLLMKAGAEFQIKPFGIRAMTAMALEKSYKLIPRELSIEYNALESGLERWVSAKKPAYKGRDGVIAAREAGLKWQLVTMEVFGVTDADARGSEPIYRDGVLVGRATSGGYGARCEKSLALAMVAPDHAAVGTELEISILGTMHRAVVIEDSPFDPENNALRS
ncbi:GcvT family protein [Novosphingobium sp.]|uniref:GcvT family protein n=1 Tax=Novosphingobium sp. TaxID=1874826 RepID=UPI003D0FC957